MLESSDAVVTLADAQHTARKGRLTDSGSDVRLAPPLPSQAGPAQKVESDCERSLEAEKTMILAKGSDHTGMPFKRRGAHSPNAEPMGGEHASTLAENDSRELMSQAKTAEKTRFTVLDLFSHHQRNAVTVPQIWT